MLDDYQKSVKYWRKHPRSIGKYKFLYHFLPHPEEKRRASLLSHHAFLFYCLMILFFIGFFKFVPRYAPGILGYASDITVNDLLNLTNERRTQAGLSSLKVNSALSRAAEKKARDMFNNDYWAHVSPTGTQPWYFILAENYDYIYAGENLAKNFSTSDEVVDAWYASPTHRDNLLNPHYDEIGFAVVDGVLDGYETTLVVQMFGKPRAGALASVNPEDEQVLPEVTAEVSTEEAEAVPPTPAEAVEEVPSLEIPEYIPSFIAQGSVLPVVDIPTASRAVTVTFGGFIMSLLGLDIWYSRKKGILKVNGHTLAHLSLLLMVLASIVFLIKPGAIL
jgi:hypothetical protein